MRTGAVERTGTGHGDKRRLKASRSKICQRICTRQVLRRQHVCFADSTAGRPPAGQPGRPGQRTKVLNKRHLGGCSRLGGVSGPPRGGRPGVDCSVTWKSPEPRIAAFGEVMGTGRSRLSQARPRSWSAASASGLQQTSCSYNMAGGHKLPDKDGREAGQTTTMSLLTRKRLRLAPQDPRRVRSEHTTT